MKGRNCATVGRSVQHTNESLFKLSTDKDRTGEDTHSLVYNKPITKQIRDDKLSKISNDLLFLYLISV